MKSWRWLLLLLLLLVLAGIYGYSTLNRFATSGTINLAGLKKTVTVVRDEKGMPYLYGESLEDLFRAQGYVIAQDRLFQMHLTRMVVLGRISEVVGADAVGLDTRMRTLGFHRQAREHLKILNTETINYLQQYVAGINAYINEGEDSHPLEFTLGGITPENWAPVDVVAVMYYMGWRSAANMQTEILSQMIIDKIGSDKFQEISPININPDDPPDSLQVKHLEITPNTVMLPQLAEYDSTLMGYFHEAAQHQGIGSNNWISGSEMSSGGKPIVASDPHLDARILPGVFYACGMISPDFRTVGVTVPGIPGLLIGRNKFLANGITNAYGDAQDLYFETLAPGQPDHYLENDEAKPFGIIKETLRIKDENAPDGYREEEITIKTTPRGPVISGIMPDLKTRRVLTVRWAPFESMQPSLGFEYLLLAKSAAEVREKLRMASTLHVNVTFADIDGTLGWQTTGRLPIRSTGESIAPVDANLHPDNWIGWVPFEDTPGQLGSGKGWIGNANHKTTTSDYPYYYSSYFASSYRYQRLKELMALPGKKTVDDHWQYQRDALNVLARSVAPLLVKTLKQDPETETLAKILSQWDYVDRVESPAPTVFQSIYRHLVKLTYEDELGDTLAATMLDTWYFWQERFQKMLEDGKSPWFDRQDTPDEQETLETIIIMAGKAAGEELRTALGGTPEEWHWGKVHRMTYTNPARRSGVGKAWMGDGPYSMGGSGETLYRALYKFSDPGEIVFSAAMRMVADLSDPDKVVAVINGGESARSFHPHQKDQIPAYHSGKKLYWWFSDAAIQENKVSELRLIPE